MRIWSVLHDEHREAFEALQGDALKAAKDLSETRDGLWEVVEYNVREDPRGYQLAVCLNWAGWGTSWDKWALDRKVIASFKNGKKSK